MATDLRLSIESRVNQYRNNVFAYDLGIITDEYASFTDNAHDQDIESVLLQTLWDNHQGREQVNHYRDENFHLRNYIYELVCLRFYPLLECLIACL